jgi:hypothetical protein
LFILVIVIGFYNFIFVDESGGRQILSARARVVETRRENSRGSPLAAFSANKRNCWALQRSALGGKNHRKHDKQRIF